MLQVEISLVDGPARLVQVPDECVIGRGAGNEIRLEGWRVSKEHARLSRSPAGVVLEDTGGFGGTTVNGRRIDGHHGPLQDGDVIGIGPYRLRVAQIGEAAGTGRAVVQAASPDSRSDTAACRNRLATEEIRASHRAAEVAQRRVLRAVAGTPEATKAGFPMVIVPDPTRQEQEREWRRRIHATLLETMDLRRQDVSAMSDDKLRAETDALVRHIIASSEDSIPEDIDRDLLRKQVLDEAVGLGPLEELLDDEAISEIMVNRHDEIYVERAGRLQKHPMSFTGDRVVLGVIERIVAPLGRRIDEASPMVDARLKDGSRVHAIIPPLALKGPALTIRKFAKRKLDAGDLVRFGALSPDMAAFLDVCVRSRKNIIVSGGTGSGKTTLLNILSNFIPAGERVITVEDAAELRLHHAHLVSLESRPANAEGKGAVSIRDLVKNTLRMRPDRIVVGECRGAEALDMLQAMNTGHEGSLTTLHANTPRDALARLETLVLMAGMDLPLAAIREQIASAVDLIVQQTRFACGTRIVTSITEITGMESGKIQLQELFRFASRGYVGPDGKIDGDFTGCDMVPGFYEDLRAAGYPLDLDMFKPPPARVDPGERVSPADMEGRHAGFGERG
ncbi:ATPase, T2SS/T4P/T4SS family [Noviherbaspirillum galbum]|uniref:Flp pilus assembly complex ATPase component n=1 Tax=Noviherbaspirillum galbum TaxID=2709383 RepID=A0A6B3SP84_9BURK|nr:ATPase, T2SS/T4P/T4SS family [Noviherbaspirillum galbum]NEX62451.1 Flp pilus assembly complex ATPase component [Noviherbaspirillum galbum]